MRYRDNAYVVYTRPYRETSAIVKLFTGQSGIISGVVKGVNNKSRQAASLRSALQIGNLIECQWQGKNSLKNIFQVDLLEHIPALSARKFICISYVNELLLHVLPEDQASMSLFEHYGELLRQIAMQIPVDLLLRRFELALLEDMGYAIDFGWDVNNDEPVQKERLYAVVPGLGVRCAANVDDMKVSGEELLLMAAKDFSGVSTRTAAKKVNRLLLDFHLDGKVLKTRRLYQELFKDNQPVG